MAKFPGDEHSPSATVWGFQFLPVSLDPYGGSGCYVNVDIGPSSASTVLLNSNAIGIATTAPNLIPNLTSIRGSTFANQYVSLDAPPGRPLALTTTNAGVGVIGY